MERAVSSLREPARVGQAARDDWQRASRRASRRRGVLGRNKERWIDQQEH
jgi:hypothetical protein